MLLITNMEVVVYKYKQSYQKSKVTASLELHPECLIRRRIQCLFIQCVCVRNFA